MYYVIESMIQSKWLTQLISMRPQLLARAIQCAVTEWHKRVKFRHICWRLRADNERAAATVTKTMTSVIAHNLFPSMTYTWVLHLLYSVGCLICESWSTGLCLHHSCGCGSEHFLFDFTPLETTRSAGDWPHHCMKWRAKSFISHFDHQTKRILMRLQNSA